MARPFVPFEKCPRITVQDAARYGGKSTPNCHRTRFAGLSYGRGRWKRDRVAGGAVLRRKRVRIGCDGALHTDLHEPQAQRSSHPGKRKRDQLVGQVGKPNRFWAHTG
jgi:hypothetical protein